MSTVAKRPGRRQTLLFLIDYSFFLSMAGAAATGVLLWLFIGKGGGEEKYLWGLHRHEWGDLHLYFSLACLLLLTVHFIQHWRWIRAVAPRQAGPANGLRGAGLLVMATVLTLGLVLLGFYAFREDPSAYGRGGGGWRRQAGTEISQTPGAKKEALEPGIPQEPKAMPTRDVYRRRWRGGRNVAPNPGGGPNSR